MSQIEKEMKKILNNEPNFQEIMTEVFISEKLDLKKIEEWRKKIKKAAWLPSFYIGFDHSLRDGEAIAINDNISVTSSGITVGPRDNDYDQSLSQTDTVRVRASWKLDQLVYHPASLQISRESRSLSKARLATSEMVYNIYSQRRLLMMQYFLESEPSPKKSLIKEKILQMGEKLNFLSRGVFSERWWSGL